MNLENDIIGVKASSLLLPAKSVDLVKWSVVACDQYTSQPEYWAEAAKISNNDPSILNLIYPEVYLNEDPKKKDARIAAINNAMGAYINSDILVEHEPGFIYVDRKTAHVKSRKGLVLTVDLEKYDFSKGSQSLIRATEKTVVERIPPRLRIREKAPLEASHIMLLIDDPEKTVIEPLAEMMDKIDKLYDFELMLNSGHLAGCKVTDPEQISGIFEALEALADTDSFRKKYGVKADKGVLLFAVGDGNHSLATAKTHWENVKKTLKGEALDRHPARYALVEVVNVHDEGLQFEPIHRVVFNIDPDQMLKAMVNYYDKNGMKASYKYFDAPEDRNKTPKSKSAHVIPFIATGNLGEITVENSKFNLEVATLQDFLDAFLKDHAGSEIDYIHGTDVVEKLGRTQGNIGFFLPAMDKNQLFRTVILDGTLPRKTFSMGEADEKRFYLECRKIV